MTNPWNLTSYEQEVIDALSITGSGEGVAKLLKISMSKTYSRLRSAKDRMGCDSVIRAAVLWDRFAMGRDEAVDNSTEAR